MALATLQIPPLLGYSSDSPTERRQVSVDGSEVSFTVDRELSLADCAAARPELSTRQVPFTYHWLMVDGVPIDQRAGGAHVLPKSIERPSPFSSKLAPPSVDSYSVYSDAVGPQDSIGEQLNSELRRYFEHVVDLFESDSEEAVPTLCFTLSTDAGIQVLLPLFLQFLAGRLTLQCDDTETVKRVAMMGLALVSNLSLPVHFFAHAFICTALTVLLRYEVGSNIDEDIEVRQIGADFLNETIRRCLSGFPTIATVAQNALIRGWLNPRTTHAAQLGAFIGICKLGRAAVLRVLPHVSGYLNSLRRELEFGDPRKRPFVTTVIVDLGQLVAEQIAGLPAEEQTKWQGLVTEIDALGKKYDAT
jgi:transcription initiation factor TFIID subunit 6